ncbi:unnamed protein product [Polarella glacialis]|uniref:Uncharacterized protein n=1 Tax=Polarella glacialis TaxID=89957 RepID=A0A813JVF8_POLGL|nr:unnamed protein product [Polarella glacialis]
MLAARQHYRPVPTSGSHNDSQPSHGPSMKAAAMAVAADVSVPNAVLTSWLFDCFFHSFTLSWVATVRVLLNPQSVLPACLIHGTLLRVLRRLASELGICRIGALQEVLGRTGGSKCRTQMRRWEQGCLPIDADQVAHLETAILPTFT